MSNTHLPEDDELPPLEDTELLDQLPKDQAILPERPVKDHVSYDRVLCVRRRKGLTREAAENRLRDLCEKRGAVPVGPPYYTARYWCQRVCDK